MLDIEQLLFTLLERDKPSGATVQLNADTAAVNEFPFVTYDYHGFGQNVNGDGLWHCVLDLNVFLDDATATFSTISAFNDAVHAWGDLQTGVVPTVGHVQTVTDLSIFSPVDDPVIQGRTVMQYAGSFTLQLRNT